MIALKSFVLDDGLDVVDAWYREHKSEPKVRARLDLRMMHLRQYDRDEPGGWTRPNYNSLMGGDGVGEVRFEVHKVAYRPLGFFGPRRSEFTFLYFAKEQSNRFVPRNALDIAIERKQIVERNSSRARLVKDRWHQ